MIKIRRMTMSSIVETSSTHSDITNESGIHSELKAMIGDKRCFMPTHLAIETVSICNADCIMCPSSVMKREKATMTPEVHQTILRKINDWGAPISLITHAGIGEPLLDKMLEERIQQEKQVFPDAQVIVYTNGSLLNEERALKLLHSGVDTVSFSINGFRNDTYEAVMKLSRDNTYRNVERFLQIKQRVNSNTNVCVSLVQTDLCAQEEVGEFRDYWKNRPVQVITPPWISWGNHFKHSFRQNQLPCFYIWKTMMIDQDGTVKMCCEDYDSQYPLGNILTQNPSDIFNSERMQNQRTNQLNGNFSWPDICQNCIESFQPAKDFWTSSPTLIVAQQEHVSQEYKQDYSLPKATPLRSEPHTQQSFNQQNGNDENLNRDRFISWLESLTQEQYKLVLGHMLAKGLDINHFDYPQGIWPPPTPARAYIEQFLNKYQSFVQGKCVEFNPAIYKDMFINKPNVSSYDVWNIKPGEGITISADLQNAINVPSNYFDTMICTHVLSAIRNVWSAAAEMKRVLKTGGLVLCTVPAVLQCYAPDPQDYWRFTKDSIQDLFADFSRYEIHSFGNPATVSGSPFYLMSYHYPEFFMHNHSEKCPSIIAIAAWK